MSDESTQTTPEPLKPALRVVKGDPTPEELAALVAVLAARSAAAADDPDAARAAFMQEYEDTFATPYIAAERGFVDAVIEPSQTRVEVAKALRLLQTKRETLPPKKHGNIPL